MTSPIIVTGAASGLGSAVAGQLRARGDHVVAFDVNDESVDVRFLDVVDGPGVEHAFRRVGPVRGVIHCAAINRGRPDRAETRIPFAEWPADEWDRVVRVNLTGTANVARAAISILEPDGRLVLVGSQETHRDPQRNFSAYGVSKAGVAQLAASLRVDHPDLQVMLFSPGGMDTGFMDVRSREDRAKMMRPDDVARLLIAAFDVRGGVVHDIVISS